jgi:hypothetical protein
MTTLDLINYILGILAISIGVWSWVKTSKVQVKIIDNISKNTNLITSTTDLLEVSSKIGIRAAHVNRQEALQKIENKLIEEAKFIVVGSSLKGLKVFIPSLEQILKARAELNLENRFLLTHPCFSIFRGRQENRTGSDIVSEIKEMASFLEDCGVNKNDIRFYMGTPTNFLVITSDIMIINPYPYQIEAFRCFCLEVERKKIVDVMDKIKKQFPKNKSKEHPQYTSIIKDVWLGDFKKELSDNPEYNYTFDIAEDIYGQFYWYHYLLPWYSKFTLTYEDYLSKCASKLEKCIDEGQQGHCELIKNVS